MSASKLPVVVELEDGYAVTFDDCVIAWRRDGDRYVVSISAVDGEDFVISEVRGAATVKTLARH
jgi:hypothetical protein